eukprot:11212184-Lingulodinium_polyedra.AAC.1
MGERAAHEPDQPSKKGGRGRRPDPDGTFGAERLAREGRESSERASELVMKKTGREEAWGSALPWGKTAAWSSTPARRPPRSRRER